MWYNVPQYIKQFPLKIKYMEKNNLSVGELIAKGREDTGLSQSELAKITNVSIKEISRIESGKREIPHPKTLKKISKHIGVKYNDLMYAVGLGARVSPLNPFLIDYYDSLKGDNLKDTIESITIITKRNKIIAYKLREVLEDNSLSKEERDAILDVAEDLEYQNNTNEHIYKLIGSKAIIENKDKKPTPRIIKSFKRLFKK